MTEGAERLESTTLGGGCFWCIEAVFQEVAGVRRVRCGYAGGQLPDPTYQQVCSGTTGHAEVVRVTFDPEVIGFRDILEIFFAVHDPTTADRQGSDVGPQYRSVILTESDRQRIQAERFIRELEESGGWDDPIVTEVVPLETLYPAEEDHQEYYRQNSRQPYCQVVITPKLAKFRVRFRDRLDGVM